MPVQGAVPGARSPREAAIPVVGLARGAAGRRFLAAAVVLLGVVWPFSPSRAADAGRVALTAEEAQWLASHAAEVRIVPEANFPPFSFVEGGVWRGISADMLRLMEARLGTSLPVLPPQNLEAILDRARRGEVGIVTSVGETPARSEYLSFTQSYASVPTIVIARSAFGNGRWPESFAGRRVAVGSGYAVQRFLEETSPGVTLVTVADDLDGLRKVSFGEVDAVVMDVASASFFIEREKITNLREVAALGYTYDLRLAVRRDLPVLRDILAKALLAIPAPDRQAVLKSWIHIDLDPAALLWFRYQSYLPISLVAFGLVVGAGATFWIHALRRAVARKTKALTKSEERYRVIVDAVPCVLYSYSNKRAGVYYSPQVESVLGYTADYLREHPTLWHDSIHPDDLPTVERLIAEGSRGQRFEVEYRIRHADQQWRVLLDRSVVSRTDESGETVIDGLAVDITDRKGAEEALRDAYRRLQGVVEGTHIGTWEWNVQTGEVTFNERWAEIVGYTLEELAPISILTWERLAHPDDLKASGDLLARHFSGGLPDYDVECRMKHKDGHWVWVHDRGRVMTRTDDGRPLTMFGTHTDITLRKQAEEALRESDARFKKLTLHQFVLEWRKSRSSGSGGSRDSRGDG